MAGIRARKYKAKGTTKYYYEISWYKDGKQYKKGGFKSKIDAQLKLREVTEDCSTDITLFELCSYYINEHSKLRCKQTTTNLYNGYLANNLVTLHNRKAKEITKREFELLIISLKDRGLSDKTINDIIGFLRSCYNYGISNEWLIKNTPKSVNKIPKKRRNIKFFNEDEIDAFISEIKKYPLNKYVPLIVALETGMRISELLALEWSDINFIKKTISINKQYYKGNLTTPKTDTSIRTISITDSLIEDLKELRANSILSKIVFCSSAGGYISQDKFVSIWFKKAVKNIGLQDYNFHCLRHTHASYLLSHGASIKYVSERLGHSSPQTTINIYEHCLPCENDSAMKLLENMKKEHNKNIAKINIV